MISGHSTPDLSTGSWHERVRGIALVLLLLSAFSGSAFLTFPVGPIALFPFRILLVGLGLFCLTPYARMTSSRSLLRSLPVMLAAIAVAYASVTLLWSLDTAMGIRHLALLGAGLAAMLLVWNLARTERLLEVTLGGWLLGVGLLLLLAFYEHLFGVHIQQSAFSGTEDWRFVHVPTGTFVNPNDLAALLALSMPMAAAILRYGRGRIVPWAGLLLAAASFYIIHATEGRAAVLAVLCEGIVLIVLLLRKDSRRKERRSTRRGWILLVMLSIVAAIGHISPLIHVAPDPNAVLPPRGELSSIGTRVNLALNGWEAIKSTYGLGVGIGGWEQWFDAHATFETEGIRAHHNWWMEIGTVLGLPFLLAYVAVYLGTLWRCWLARVRAASDKEKMLTEAALLGLVGFFFASLGPSNFLGFAPQWLFWGFALAVLGWSRRQSQEDRV